MVNDNPSAPLRYQGVTISSTFTDLKEHRAALVKAIKGNGLTDVAMENDSAKPGLDVIASSLQMVRDGLAYIGVIGRKYGQMPESSDRNPNNLSITELEFDEALRLGRPVLLFIMGEKHPVIEADVEIDASKREKLNAFRKRAKQMGPDSPVHRVYNTFDSLEEFKEKAAHAVASLRRYLDEQAGPTVPPADGAADAVRDSIPRPPAFYAEPRYMGSHEFLGRQSQLETLDDWAAPADLHPILLFEAIGGAGKSLLTWEWTTKHATRVREDWAGRFWYSFYEKGAVMADFCRRALAYITGQPLKDFRKKKTVELGELLLRHLQDRPWLLILDGLERVLVAYHRFDAAQVADEEAVATDKIAQRDPSAAIRSEDDDLLRVFAAAAPSKLLITSRLIPRVLLSASGQPIPGVLLERLPGLRPADAEALLRACGVTGTSSDIQNYLKRHCDCHPLVTGVLAGLINDYLPDRGNFDAWADDPDHGGHLNLADLDLVQKRNHILHAALDALPEKSRQLLSTLALLSEAFDYPTLSALNPHLPPEPEEVKEPEKPEDDWEWGTMSDEEKEQTQQNYQVAFRHRKEYEQALTARQQSPEFLASMQELIKTIRDLERRGLLQYDPQAKRYDLHPIVRGTAAGGLRPEEKERYGQRVIDHFSRQTHSPYEEAETLDDIRYGLHVVRTLLQMDRYQEAADVYCGDLSNALRFNLEAHNEILSLLRPFFPQGWTTLPQSLAASVQSYLADDAAYALLSNGEPKEAISAYGAALLADARQEVWSNVINRLSNISAVYSTLSRFAKEERCRILEIDLATLIDSEHSLFNARLGRFRQLSIIGQWKDAEEVWQSLDPMGRDWPRASYRPGDAEHAYALCRFWQGELREEHLSYAEELSKSGKNRGVIRHLHGLRGAWLLEQDHWSLAADSLQEAVRMAREVGQSDVWAETQLALAKFRLMQLPDHRREAEYLSKTKQPAHRALAELWLAIDNREQAKKHALMAYKWAWADGEPYVHRYELNKATFLLEQLGAELPKLPPYDSAKDETLPWEDELAAAIEKQYTGSRGAAILAARWEDYLHGRRSRYGLPTLAKGFPTLRVVQLRLQNIGVFVDTGVVDFTHGPILLLGNNAAGKSTVLKCLALAAIGSEAANEVEDAAASYLRNGTSRGTIEVVFDLIPKADCEPDAYGRFAVGLGIDLNSGRFTPLPHAEMTLRPRDLGRNCLEQINALRNETKLSFGFASAYGATRSFSDNRFAEEPEHPKRENEWVLSLFHANAWLTNPETLSKLLRGDTRNIKDAPESLAANVAGAMQKSFLQLLPNAEKMFSDSISDITLNGVPLKFHDLSEGYRSVLAFVGHIVRCALRLTDWVDDPFMVSGIVLVDEIEAHLHPAWQRHIIADLQRLFPNIQWICSSHSALVAGALAPNSILLLEPHGDHIVPQPINQSFQGWRADQILTSLLFGLETSRDEETSGLLRRYRELALNPALSSEEEEEFSELGGTLGLRVPTVSERGEAREAMKIFDVALNDLLGKKSPEELQRLNDELLLRVQDALSN